MQTIFKSLSPTDSHEKCPSHVKCAYYTILFAVYNEMPSVLAIWLLQTDTHLMATLPGQPG